MAEPSLLTNDDAATWFAAEMPETWFSDARVLVDRDEIMVIGTLGGDTSSSADADADPATTAGAEKTELDQIEWFREETRDARIAIAQRAEALFGRKVSWATGCGTTEAAFTHLSVPVMTRLRMPERQILDTLVAAGAARSRSDALGWCVRLVARHESDWLDELREAIDAVDKVRAQGPS
jgi:hypothetical protein